jgi:hypothetical protein
MDTRNERSARYDVNVSTTSRYSRAAAAPPTAFLCRLSHGARPHQSPSNDAPVSRANHAVGRVLPKAILGGLQNSMFGFELPQGARFLSLSVDWTVATLARGTMVMSARLRVCCCIDRSLRSHRPFPSLLKIALNNHGRKPPFNAASSLNVAYCKQMQQDVDMIANCHFT